MSLDRSLKTKGSLVRHRNVLTRAERITILREKEEFEDGHCPYGLPKVAHRKAPVGGKVKKVRKEGEEEATAVEETGSAKDTQKS